MPRIVDLDADRAGIDVGLAGPDALACVPGALRLSYELRDPPLLIDEVMARHARLLACQPIERRVRGLHAGVMQEQHVRFDPVPPRLAIRRGTPQPGERTVGGGSHSVLEADSVIPAQAGIHRIDAERVSLDPGLRRDDALTRKAICRALWRSDRRPR